MPADIQHSKILRYVDQQLDTSPVARKLFRSLAGADRSNGARVDVGLQALDAAPALYNPALSWRGPTPLGDGLHVPTAVSDRDGGRPSVLELRPGQTVTVGAVVTDSDVFIRSFERLDLRGRVRDGSLFREHVARATGEPAYSLTYRANAVQLDQGVVHFQPYAESLESKSTTLGPIVVSGGICWICIGSVWWCGLPCVPLPGRGSPTPREPEDAGSAGV